jgi:hypothetical protein
LRFHIISPSGGRKQYRDSIHLDNENPKRVMNNEYNLREKEDVRSRMTYNPEPDLDAFDYKGEIS